MATQTITVDFAQGRHAPIELTFRLEGESVHVSLPDTVRKFTQDELDVFEALSKICRRRVAAKEKNE